MAEEKFEQVQTDDLAMTVYLNMMGHTQTALEWDLDHRTCRWTFDQAAVADAECFLRDEARVNPREYTRFFARAKWSMYNAKDIATENL